MICAAIILINLSFLPWDEKDLKIINRAMYVCANDERYKKEFPCVKSVTKHPEQHYGVICGAKK